MALGPGVLQSCLGPMLNQLTGTAPAPLALALALAHFHFHSHGQAHLAGLLAMRESLCIFKQQGGESRERKDAQDPRPQPPVPPQPCLSVGLHLTNFHASRICSDLKAQRLPSSHSPSLVTVAKAVYTAIISFEKNIIRKK